MRCPGEWGPVITSEPMWRSLAGRGIKLGQFTVLSYAANPAQPPKQLKLVRMSGGAE